MIIETDTTRDTTDEAVMMTPAVGNIFESMVVAGDEHTSEWMDWINVYRMWIQSKLRRNKSGSTAQNYNTAFLQFFKWASTPPWEVTPEIAEQWAAHLSTEGKEIKDRGGNVIRREPVADSTFNLKLAALGDFYKFVMRKTDLWPANLRNPFDIVDRQKVGAFERSVYPTADELQAMLDTINTDTLTGKRDFSLIFTYIVTTRRSRELLNIKWGDLKETAEGDFAFEYIYKGGDLKKAVIPRMCYATITAYLQADGRLENIGPDDYIWIPIDEQKIKRLNPDAEIEINRPISNSLVNRILKKYAKRAGVDVKKAHVHGLRHGGARLRRKLDQAAGKPVDYAAYQQLLGHKNIATTQIYVDTVVVDPVDEGGNAAARFLMPKGGKRRRAKEAPGEQLPLE